MFNQLTLFINLFKFNDYEKNSLYLRCNAGSSCS